MRTAYWQRIEEPLLEPVDEMIHVAELCLEDGVVLDIYYHFDFLYSRRDEGIGGVKWSKAQIRDTEETQ